ncbi:hypothetical protein [Teredinibacter sp. KSP-S5-2]|uniref:hypothetical protein n=1 Tax=Teredinibacter sp. KSP-S5-2 TaxID=3034506 RepID=UPI002934FD2A|nr:hypothetical protein [Teredinibacter sp. KSP-S5-2]WNO09243.1 hypothetical protein P5V12_20070 [Teredinibacter sp. KSP-S5-2]
MKFPESLTVESDGNIVKASMTIDESYEYFEGHFVGAPVLAGVVQIGLVMAILERALGIRLAFKGMRSVKFTQLIQPPTNIDLMLQYLPEKGVLKYKIENELGKCAAGNLMVEPMELPA